MYSAVELKTVAGKETLPLSGLGSVPQSATGIDEAKGMANEIYLWKFFRHQASLTRLAQLYYSI